MHTHLSQMLHILNRRDAIRVQIQHVEARHAAETVDAPNRILAEHEDAQVRARVQTRDDADLIIVQVEKHEIRLVVQVRNRRNLIVFVIQQPQLRFSLDHTTRSQAAPVQVEPIGAGGGTLGV